jgi:hypothetical protein
VKDRVIRDKVVFTVTGKMQELLLREKKLDLLKIIDICHAFEITSRQQREMAAVHIDRVSTLPVTWARPKQLPPRKWERKPEERENNGDWIKDC